MLTLVTGPVRSGKSRFAERLAGEAGGPVTYAATARADASDPEWTARIAHHATRRPAAWRIVETAPDGDGALAGLLRATPSGTTLLVDSLGTWLGAAMRAEDPDIDVAALDGLARALADACAACRGHAIVVGDEVGWGIVPAYASARAFRDVLGRLQQRLTATADRAYLVVAGRAIDLHAVGRPVDAEVRS